jgi:[protein-PII] uridylyltransferase
MSFLDVENRRAIIDRRALADRIGGLRASKKLSGETAAILRGALEYGRAEIAKRLTEAPGNGRAAAQATAFLHDQLIRLAYDFVTERVLDQPRRTCARRPRRHGTWRNGAVQRPRSDVPDR